MNQTTQTNKKIVDLIDLYAKYNRLRIARNNCISTELDRATTEINEANDKLAVTAFILLNRKAIKTEKEIAKLNQQLLVNPYFDTDDIFDVNFNILHKYLCEMADMGFSAKKVLSDNHKTTVVTYYSKDTKDKFSITILDDNKITSIEELEQSDMLVNLHYDSTTFFDVILGAKEQPVLRDALIGAICESYNNRQEANEQSASSLGNM